MTQIMLDEFTNGIPPLFCGVDIVEIEYFARVLQWGGERFLHHIYTDGELQFCRGRLPQLAVRLAAKEATAKALGTGFRKNISWQDIEISSNPYGQPFVLLHRNALIRAKQLNLFSWCISLSHSQNCAIAFVVLLQQGQIAHEVFQSVSSQP